MGDEFTAETVKDLIHEEIGSQFKELQEEMKARQSEWAAKMLVQPVPAKAADNGLRVGRFVRAMAAAKGDPERASRIVASWGDEALAKALAESVFSAGGAIVPEEFAVDVIDLLAARAVVRSMGAESIPMETGSITMPFLATGSTAAYVGENTNIGKTEQTFGQLKLTERKLAALVPGVRVRSCGSSTRPPSRRPPVIGSWRSSSRPPRWTATGTPSMRTGGSSATI